MKVNINLGKKEVWIDCTTSIRKRKYQSEKEDLQIIDCHTVFCTQHKDICCGKCIFKDGSYYTLEALLEAERVQQD